MFLLHRYLLQNLPRHHHLQNCPATTTSICTFNIFATSFASNNISTSATSATYTIRSASSFDRGASSSPGRTNAFPRRRRGNGNHSSSTLLSRPSSRLRSCKTFPPSTACFTSLGSFFLQSLKGLFRSHRPSERTQSPKKRRSPTPQPPPPPPPPPPLPSWPPAQSEYSPGRAFKVLFDPAVDSASSSYTLFQYPNTRLPSYYRGLIEHVRKHSKGKGKEILYRYEGEVLRPGPDEMDIGDMKEDEVVPSDPRKNTSIRRPSLIRRVNTELIPLKYEYDVNSTGPPPLPNTVPSLSFEPQIDKENGSALGIVFVKFQTHEEAKRCVEREHGRKGGIGALGVSMMKPGEVEEWKVVFDGEGVKLKAVLKELDERKKKEREDKRKGVNGGSSGPSSIPNGLKSSAYSHEWDWNTTIWDASSMQQRPVGPNGPPAHPKCSLPPRPSASVVSAAGPTTSPTSLGLTGIGFTTQRHIHANNLKDLRPVSAVLQRARAKAAAMHSKPSQSKSATMQKKLAQATKGVLAVYQEEEERTMMTMMGADKSAADGRRKGRRWTFLTDHTGLYVPFEERCGAAVQQQSSATRRLGMQSEKAHWDDVELVEAAQKMVVQELRICWRRTSLNRIVAHDLKKIWQEEKSKSTSTFNKQLKPLERKGLKGLSFKKAKKVVVVEVEEKQEPEQGQEREEEEEESEIDERPKKKRKTDMIKKPARKVIDEEDLESEEEDEEDLARLAALAQNGRPSVLPQKIAKRRKRKNQRRQEIQESSARARVACSDQLRLDSALESSLSPSRSPTPVVIQPKQRRKRPLTPPPTPPPDPSLRISAKTMKTYITPNLPYPGEMPSQEKLQAPAAPADPDVLTFRKHLTGSARTEGYYKITHAEKAATCCKCTSIVDEPQPQHITSSRSTVQRAVALSKGETANELTFKFNQLQTRKKHLRFARSPIHDWGLYAMEKISRGEMVIEYVGEIIRAQVAGQREKAYERQGIGSSYLFRIDEDLVVDATKKGNLGCSLINHSCDPNCTAKIITISGEKKIVIYAKQDIELGDEITYDYHFPFEQDKIPCRGFLN
ncbi:hypothetical protein CPB84DRAFT_1789433 [Gymnopilus junonius]|uniref:[histone H3]-lysine(4) N-trimethyltransferase n=1 Tax=Gymnopilus junonius TaxID=109634 RepID=A0A9P5NHT3_GYMJU|nr:hypothetical protein CPB84DRAFT_1789433 [Gymnopilus junonius]